MKKEQFDTLLKELKKINNLHEVKANSYASMIEYREMRKSMSALGTTKDIPWFKEMEQLYKRRYWVSSVKYKTALTK